MELALGGYRYFATIKEVFVDSGKTKRILCKLDATSKQELCVRQNAIKRHCGD